MTGWRRSRLVASIVIVAFVIVQLAIPLSRFGDDTARRFGWQMFSTSSPAPDFVVVTSTNEVDIALGDYLAMRRADVDFTEHMPPHLCAAVPDAQQVTWDDGSYEC